MKNLQYTKIYRVVLVGITLLLGMLSSVAAQSNTDAPAVYWFDWSEDGTKIAVATDEGISIYDANFQQLAFRPQPDPTGARSFTALSPDGTRLTTGKEVWDTQTLEPLFEVETEYPLGDWSHDGTQVSGVASGAHAIVTFDGFTGKLLKTISTGDIPLFSNPHWSPDNSRFAFTAIGKRLIIFSMEQEQIIAQYPYENVITTLTWSPDSKYISYFELAEVKPGTPNSYDSTTSLTGAFRNSVYVFDPVDGEVLQAFTGLTDTITELIWSPNGTQLTGATPLGPIYVWDVNSGQLVDSYAPSGSFVGIDYSPFGGQIMLGFNLYRDISSSNLDSFVAQSTFSRSLLGGAIQIAIPDPSIDQLQAISEACIANPVAEAALAPQININQLDAFTAQVEALAAQANPSIPPGCAADLIAVAEALQSAP